MNAKGTSSLSSTSCGGFGSLKNWFSDQSACEDILPRRLAIGLGVFFTCAYFGEKADREKGTAGDQARVARTASTRRVDTTNQRTVSNGAGFEANRHRPSLRLRPRPSP